MQIRLTLEEHQELEALSKELGRDKSDIARTAIKQFTARARHLQANYKGIEHTLAEKCCDQPTP